MTRNSINSSPLSTYTFVFIYVLSDFLARGKNDICTRTVNATFAACQRDIKSFKNVRNLAIFLRQRKFCVVPSYKPHSVLKWENQCNNNHMLKSSVFEKKKNHLSVVKLATFDKIFLLLIETEGHFSKKTDSRVLCTVEDVPPCCSWMGCWCAPKQETQSLWYAIKIPHSFILFKWR